ncbi:MAG: UDP-N-acetylmuramoyl-L-alanine--D-glutamate ligase [Candidatus Binatia bacterium]
MSSRPRTLLVLGLARSGVAAARVAAAEGWNVLVTDDKPVATDDLPASVQPLDAAEALARAGDADLVIPSPGIPATHPVLEAARNAGVRIAPEIEFAADRLGGTLVAITGTNGKSTAVSLLGAVLEAAGHRVFTGGNLGDPLCNAVGREWDYVVAEVSSFQLEHATTFHPHAAAMLNLTPDHLDRHGDMEGYLSAKLKLFACMTPGDFVVLPREGWWTARAAGSTRANLTTFSVGDAATGREIVDGAYHVRLPAKGWPELPHDLENAAAAVAMARVLNVDAAAVERAIAGFRPLRHRLAKVADVAGVAYWNDSKATNVGAALSSLRAFEGRVVLLAGGVSKGCDFAALATEARRITLVVAYGQAAAEIEGALAGSGMRIVREAGLESALERAAREATPGDVVLLAPACASFDEFRDYADRGSSFEKWVARLSPSGRADAGG